MITMMLHNGLTLTISKANSINALNGSLFGEKANVMENHNDCSSLLNVEKNKFNAISLLVL